MKKLFILLTSIILIGLVYIVYDLHRSKEKALSPAEVEIRDILQNVQQTQTNKRPTPISVPDTTETPKLKEVTLSEEPIIENNNTTPPAEVIEDTLSVAPKPQSDPETPTLTKLKSGFFDRDAIGSDQAHHGTGTVEIHQQADKLYLIFRDDFDVTNGPDYKIYLTPKAGVDTEEKFLAVKSNSIRVDDLDQFSGYQSYEISNWADQLSQVRSVVIWCEAFSEFISSADLSN